MIGSPASRAGVRVVDRALGGPVLLGRQTGLADVVPARPGEVADHVRQVLEPLPDRGRQRGAGLAAHDHALRVELRVDLVPADHVVVAGDVEVGVRVTGPLVDGGETDDAIEHPVEDPDDQVEDPDEVLVGVLAALPRRCSLGGELLLVLRGDEVEEPVDAVGDQPRGVELAGALGEASVERDPAGRGGLGDLVADRVHDHAGVVDVVGDERLEVALPPLGEVEAVVEGDLGPRPRVGELVHDEHAVTVARAQQRAGRRVVGAADGVEAGRLEDADPSVLGRVECVWRRSRRCRGGSPRRGA